MVPAITETGRSFKGAALYYLHDKQADTAERVAWTETVNLPTDDPDRAWRMMAHTAMAQAELKAAAGIKATGRKLTAPVLAYSLAWHPDEQPDRAEMTAAAHASLKALGLEDHQAVLVCHTDEPHAHVHVLVNRVHPTTGKAATLSNSKRQLSAWALAYEKERGAILCPQREENAKKRAQGEKTRDRRKPRKEIEARPPHTNENFLRFSFVMPQEQAKDAQLADRERALKESHARQWRQASETYRAGKATLGAGRDADRRKEQDQARQRHARQWEALRLKHSMQRHIFRQREGSFLGFVWNALAAMRELRRQEREAGRDDPARFEALTLFAAAFSSAERRGALDAAQQRERRETGREQRAELKAIGDRHWSAYREKLADLHQQFTGHAEAIKAQQQADRQQIKAAWRERRREFAVAMLPFRNRTAKWARVEELGAGAQIRSTGLQRSRQRTRTPPPPGNKPEPPKP